MTGEDASLSRRRRGLLQHARQRRNPYRGVRSAARRPRAVHPPSPPRPRRRAHGSPNGQRERLDRRRSRRSARARCRLRSRAIRRSAALATPAARYRGGQHQQDLHRPRRVAPGRRQARLDLDAPVLPSCTRRLPKFSVQDAVATITARELLVQSSGLPTAWGMYFADDERWPVRAPRRRPGRLSGHLVDDPGAQLPVQQYELLHPRTPDRGGHRQRRSTPS